MPIAQLQGSGIINIPHNKDIMTIGLITNLVVLFQDFYFLYMKTM